MSRPASGTPSSLIFSSKDQRIDSFNGFSVIVGGLSAKTDTEPESHWSCLLCFADDIRIEAFLWAVLDSSVVSVSPQ
jgi:hypothetical protein